MLFTCVYFHCDTIVVSKLSRVLYIFLHVHVCSYSIHQGLESNDQVEVEAAIYATSCLCRHSATFASSVCEKIAEMVQGT